MQKMSKPVSMLWLALVIGDLAVVAYLHFAGGLAYTPVPDLPLLYWVLLLLVPVLQLAPVVVLGVVPMPRGRSSEASLGVLLLSGGLSLLLALFNHLTQPEWGGNTVLFAALGCISFASAYTMYRRMQASK
ncbi:MAG TPA: hypothetical protein VFH60_07080 [Chloroflexia bacterium]|nr:hypothetical protein [Chloroflexia bacterium]